MNSLAGKVKNRTSTLELIRMILVIALPVALQNLLTTTGSMLDTVMIASLGENSVGAVGLCAQFSTLLFAGYWGFAGGGTLFISQYYGAKDHDNVCRSYGMMFSFMMISGIVFGYLAVFQADAVMKLYTGSENIQKIGAEYLRIAGISYPLQVIAMAQSVLLRSVEEVRIPMFGGIAAVITNFCVNLVLIFGYLGFPAMGVRGAAIGTICSQLVNIFVIIILAKAKKIPYLLEFRKHFGWNLSSVATYLRKSSMIIANEVLIGVGNMLINIVLGHQADFAIAATAVFRTIEGVLIAFFSGFSNAATVLVGKEIGAGNHEEGWSRAYRLVYLLQGLILCACLVLLAVHRPLLHVMGLSGRSYDTAFYMLLAFSVIAVIRLANWCMNDTFRVGGDPSFGSAMEITFMYLMVQPVIHIANDYLHLPFLAVFVLCYCDEPIRFVIMQIHMYSGKWIRPVSEAGQRTIGEFRRKYGIEVKTRGS